MGAEPTEERWEQSPRKEGGSRAHERKVGAEPTRERKSGSGAHERERKSGIRAHDAVPESE